MNYKIMLVDDEGFILKSLKRVLARVSNYDIECYESAELALKRVQTGIYDVFVSDYRMPEMNGVDFLKFVREIQPEAMRIILSAFTEIDTLMAAINDAEIFRFIAKPWSDADLLQTVEQAIDYKNTISENRHLAEMVRKQQNMLKNQKSALDQLQKAHPELGQVNWEKEGAIRLDADLARSNKK